MTQQNLPMQGLTVCPDGAHAFFNMPNRDTRALNIFRLDLQSGSATAVTNGKIDQNPVCSPDSKFVIYSKLEQGKQLLMEIPVTGGQARQLSDKIVDFGAISPDGKQIAALAVEGQGVNAKPMIEIFPRRAVCRYKAFLRAAPSPACCNIPPTDRASIIQLRRKGSPMFSCSLSRVVLRN